MYRASLPSVIAAALLCGMSVRADAADYLRGAYAGETAPRAVAGVDWGGFYGGAHAGYSSVNNSPTGLTGASVPPGSYPAAYGALMPNAVTSFPSLTKNGMSYGAFAGINYLWDDVVLGVEADYTHSSIKADSTRTARNASGGAIPQYVVNNTQTAQARPTDWGTLRARAGYAMGMFMPFVTLGVAAGNVNSRITNSGTWAEYNTTTGALVASGTYATSAGKNGLMYGAAFGAGMDMQFLPNTFMRAEWQAVQFTHKVGRPDLMIHTARVAGGVKF
jgi:outer membrane immunogenic protein